MDLYLLPFFEGETYELVSKLGVPIIGPAAIIYLLKHEVIDYIAGIAPCKQDRGGLWRSHLVYSAILLLLYYLLVN